MRWPGRKSLPGEPAQEVHQNRNRQDAQRRQHGMSRAPRTAQAGIDQREPRGGKRNQENEQNTKRRGCFGKPRNGRVGHLLSLRKRRWDRITRTNPNTSTPVPAVTKPVISEDGRRSAIALRTIPHPARSSRKPAILIAPNSG